MRRFVPDSLGGWVFTVVVTAVILLYGSWLVTYVIFRDESAAAAAASQAADQLIVFKRIIERADPQERIALIRGLNSPSLRMVITSRPLVDESDDAFTSRIVYRRLEREFPNGTEIRTDSRIVDTVGEERFPTLAEVRREARRFMGDVERQVDPGDFDNPPKPPRPEIFDLERPTSDFERGPLNFDRALQGIRGFQPFIRASVKVGNTTWLNARVDLDLTESSARTRPFLITTILTLVVAVMAIWAVRRTTKPVSRFATAAENLGLGRDAGPLPETGTGEVRRAARAFNTMQDRLKRFISDRTQMLAAISHDLRTPITRMKLRAEFVDDDEQRTKMLSDLDEMEAMIKVTLAFAQDDAANEPAISTDVAAMLKTVLADHPDRGQKVAYEGPESFGQLVRPVGLKRALTNLVDNALNYGESVSVNLSFDDQLTKIFIDDNGPGIPDEMKEQVFIPFFRVEGSRSRDTGGVGLGMTIARNAVRSMGGDIKLLDRPEGGLRVQVTVPRQA